MTLILARGANGKIIGRCDIRCYGATARRCNCICGGENHGKGWHQDVIDQTERVAQEIRKEHPHYEIRTPVAATRQMLLF